MIAACQLPPTIKMAKVQLRSCLEIPTSSQPLRHDAGHGDVYPGLVCPGESLVALAQAAGVVEPTEGALYHPTPGQQHERPALLGAQHHRQAELEPRRNPVHQSSRVASIHPNLPELLAAARQMRQQPPGTVAILHAGGGHRDRQQQPQRIHHLTVTGRRQRVLEPAH